MPTKTRCFSLKSNSKSSCVPGRKSSVRFSRSFFGLNRPKRQQMHKAGADSTPRFCRGLITVFFHFRPSHCAVHAGTACPRSLPKGTLCRGSAPSFLPLPMHWDQSTLRDRFEGTPSPCLVPMSEGPGKTAQKHRSESKKKAKLQGLQIDGDKQDLTAPNSALTR